MYIDKCTMHVLYIVIFVFVNCVCVMGRRPYITNKLTHPHFNRGIHLEKGIFAYLDFVIPVPIAQMVERPLREREVVGSIPGRAIPKILKMVPVATLLVVQHYKASTGSSLTHY